MRNNSWKLVIVTASVILFGSALLVGIRAQPGPKNPSASFLTTNWVGCLVIGEKDTMDAISPGAHPKPMQHVEIGLRSDGVVIWRNAQNAK